ncbi:hypothetical protein ACWD01_13080 [Streptomyces sp. NPDC002835]
MQPDLIATAQRELADAQQVLAALQERVREGDTDITPDQLAAQRELIGFAELRVEAAHRKHAAETTADRERRAQAAAQAGRDLLAADDTQPIIDAVRAAADALRHLVKVAADRNAAIGDAAQDLVAINAELKNATADDHSWPIDQFGVRAMTSPASVIVLGEGSTRAVYPGRLAAAALHLALTGDKPEQEHARKFMSGLPNQVIARIGEDIPGLADALRLTPEEWEAATPEQRRELTAQERRPVDTSPAPADQ